MRAVKTTNLDDLESHPDSDSEKCNQNQRNKKYPNASSKNVADGVPWINPAITNPRGNSELSRIRRRRALFYGLIVILAIIGCISIYFLAAGGDFMGESDVRLDDAPTRVPLTLKDLTQIKRPKLSIFNECLGDLDGDCHNRVMIKYYESLGYVVARDLPIHPF